MLDMATQVGYTRVKDVVRADERHHREMFVPLVHCPRAIPNVLADANCAPKTFQNPLNPDCTCARHRRLRPDQLA